MVQLTNIEENMPDNKRVTQGEVHANEAWEQPHRIVQNSQHRKGVFQGMRKVKQKKFLHLWRLVMRFAISVVYKGKRYRDGPIYHFNVIAKVYLHDALRSNIN